jgi:hypothetical protein
MGLQPIPHLGLDQEHRIPYPIDCRNPAPIDMHAFRVLLSQAHTLAVDRLHLSPRLAPRETILCTYRRWFVKPTSIQRLRLLNLPLDNRKVRTFLRFRLGVHDLCTDVGKRNKLPPNARICCKCGLAVGDEHHFIFHCSALAPLRLRYSHLFSHRRLIYGIYLAREDIVAVVNFICEGFQIRSQLRMN